MRHRCFICSQSPNSSVFPKPQTLQYRCCCPQSSFDLVLMLPNGLIRCCPPLALLHPPDNARYPNGESYLDVIQRLEPVVIEIERERENVCIIAHQAILRAMYGYFTNKPLADIPTLEIPLHTVIELTPKADGTMTEERFFTGIPTTKKLNAARPPLALSPGTSPIDRPIRSPRFDLGNQVTMQQHTTTRP